jgi:hypothetical protein
MTGLTAAAPSRHMTLSDPSAFWSTSLAASSSIPILRPRTTPRFHPRIPTRFPKAGEDVNPIDIGLRQLISALDDRPGKSTNDWSGQMDKTAQKYEFTHRM